MSDPGYYRNPTIFNETVVFNAEDDLWAVPVQGGVARRLTAGVGLFGRAAFTSDGTHLAFPAREEGQADLYIMPAPGGPLTRLTYTGGIVTVAGFTPEGDVVFASMAKTPLRHPAILYQVPVTGGEPKALPWGPALAIAYGPHGGIVLGRHTQDPARWKRYRGGTVGQIWIDPEGRGEFTRLQDPSGNLASPMWIGSRIYFLSDHEGTGNLYSVRPDGSDLKRHTDHDQFYARNASTDGRRIVYHSGADLYVYTPEDDVSRLIPVEFHSQRTQRERKYVDASLYLEQYAPHPKKPDVLVTTRGQLFGLGMRRGPVRHLGPGSQVRCRLAQYLGDAGDVVAIDDAGGEERLVKFSASGVSDAVPIVEDKFGRAIALSATPTGDRVALANHRHELWLVDMEGRAAQMVDHSRFGRIEGLSWSPDGQFLAYSFPNTTHTTAIRVLEAKTGQIRTVTDPVLRDSDPAWDPEGRYLYFLSARTFDPVYDNLTFDLGFPRGMRPYLITLQADQPSPFIDKPPRQSADSQESDKHLKEAPITIDFDGIRERIQPFPVREGLYGQIVGLGNKVIWSTFPVSGSLARSGLGEQPSSDGMIEMYDLTEQKRDILIQGIIDFRVSHNRETLIYRSRRKLRSVKAGEKPEDKDGEASSDQGYLDWHRIPVLVDPAQEWEQMLREAWRLMRDNFWTPDMSGVDWPAMYARYRGLLPRVTTRNEFSDLVWEMQGELGTSHAYELGGDYRTEPTYPRGTLAADYTYDQDQHGWRLTHIVEGDPSTEGFDSPLRAPGVNVSVGDVITAIDGQPVSFEASPDYLLINRRNREVALTIKGPHSLPRTVVVKTLAQETDARYREWVNRNRRQVHEATKGRVGYVHIPDMGPRGFAEFFRGYLGEVQREALIIDVRFNGGGHVSPLILEKLSRRRIGYDFPRWEQPVPYPHDSPAGPLVALTNENAGSDGDIFSHAFKMMGLGPLVGQRTWGGVIGIEIHHTLVDGSITSQPEYSFWFKDVGFGVENYGTDPTIPVAYRPQDYAAGQDPQLTRSIEEALRLLADHPADEPPDAPRPSRAVPPLPPRPPHGMTRRR